MGALAVVIVLAVAAGLLLIVEGPYHGRHRHGSCKVIGPGVPIYTCQDDGGRLYWSRWTNR